MTAWRQVLEMTIGDEDLSRLTGITQSRTEPASRVERARCCWHTERTHRSLPYAGLWECIIRLYSAAWSGMLPMVR